jgi:hypothetical protein
MLDFVEGCGDGRRMIFCCTKKSVDPGGFLSGNVVTGLESENSRVVVGGDVEKSVCEECERGGSQIRAPTTTTLPCAFKG